MAFFWPCSHEGQTFFDLLAKIQARRIKRSNDWGKTLFFKKNLVLFIVELSVIFFWTLIFSTLDTTLNSTLDILVEAVILPILVYYFTYILHLTCCFLKKDKLQNFFSWNSWKILDDFNGQKSKFENSKLLLYLVSFFKRTTI